jgi:hypothetical protein
MPLSVAVLVDLWQRLGLSRLPLIPRCVVIGAVCTGTLTAVVTVVNVIGEYPAGHLVQVIPFGILEAYVLGGVAGCVLGFVVGVFAYLARIALGAVEHRRS